MLTSRNIKEIYSGFGLQMEQLMTEAGTYAAANLPQLVMSSADLGALSDDLLAAIACRTSEACLEQLHACLPLPSVADSQSADAQPDSASLKSR